MFNFGGWARNDLADYRAHYPNNKEDLTINDNVRFYRNEIPLRPEKKTIEEIHREWYGNWEWLEYCHSYIQWLFPIQESGLNWQAQILQKHEIVTMKSDPQILRRVLKSFQLMLDFYGFEIVLPNNSSAAPAATSSSSSPSAAFKTSEDASVVNNSSSAKNDDKNEEEDEEDEIPDRSAALDPNSHARIVRIQDPNRGFKKQFHNLNTSGHNYLRITRMCKFLGELGLEHLKLAWLAAFEKEIFEDKFLYNCLDSYCRYWIGTIYDDDLRADVEERANKNKDSAEQMKKEAWAARFGVAAGSGSSSSIEKSTITTTKKTTDQEDAEATSDAVRVITNFGNNNALNDDDESDSQENNNKKYMKAPETYVFRVATSDMEDGGAASGSSLDRTNTSGNDDAQ